jgi:hypothetical protein
MTVARISICTVSVILIGLTTTPAKAQHPTQPADTTNPDKIRQQDQSQREMQLRNLAAQTEMSTNPRRREEVGAEIQQDFQKILTLHNELARIILNNKPIDYDFISEAGGEIRKRAIHLQKTLVLNSPDNEPNQEEQPDLTDAPIKDVVAVLCTEIKRFVTNPVIDQPGTVNAPELARARRDLQGVIELSGNLKKSADRFKKSSP